MDDLTLVERARSGDKSAFTELVVRYQDQLYTMALRVLGKPVDAADVVQETFLRAYAHLPELRGETVRAWLFRVAINASRDLQRQHQRHPIDPLEDKEGNTVEVPDTSEGPEVHAERNETALAIRDALAQLPENFRQVVVMRDINDLAYEEIAWVMHLPLGTVKSRIARGRLMLAELLGPVLRTDDVESER